MKTFVKVLMIITAWLVPSGIFAQQVQGTVFGKSDAEGKVPLPGVNIYWAETLNGVVSDVNGNFTIMRNPKSEMYLVFSFIGYANDTLMIMSEKKDLKVVLEEPRILPEFTVSERANGTSISLVDPIQTQNIHGAELKKAACCNLSESFETNASVDVNYSDAVTGAKMIQLLGLSGSYVQLMFENMPDYQGIHSPFSLSFLPGPWLESIQISKGAASVVGGYQSITGQINTELKKPDAKEWLFLNLFGNNSGRLEFNGNVSRRFNDKVSTMVLAHAAYNDIAIDHDHDGFMDMPLMQRYHVINRWKYHNGDNMFQIGVGLLGEERIGGQDASFFSETQPSELYQTHAGSNRLNFFAKGGTVLDKKGNHTLAFLSNASISKLDLNAGHNTYLGDQTSVNARLVYRVGMKQDVHQLLLGISEFYDDYSESYNDSAFARTENVPGALFEYTYKPNGTITMMGGLRYDMHNIYGGFFTPRVHIRYAPISKLIIRAAAGTGRRTPNLFADNSGILATSRKVVVTEDPKMEVATNYGISATYYTTMFNRDMVITADFHRTSFQNQLIVDLDSDEHAILVGNLDGQSFSNNFQLEISYEPIRHLQLLAAAKYSDVEQTYGSTLMDKPFVKNFRGLFTASYLSNLQRWQFDATFQLNGSSRLPVPPGWPEGFNLEPQSPVYAIINAQVTKNFKHWSLYLGAENLTNYKQSNPILGNMDPFGEYFDASRIWGPLDGIKVYGGIRISLETKEKH